MFVLVVDNDNDNGYVENDNDTNDDVGLDLPLIHLTVVDRF